MSEKLRIDNHQYTLLSSRNISTEYMAHNSPVSSMYIHAHLCPSIATAGALTSGSQVGHRWGINGLA